MGIGSLISDWFEDRANEWRDRLSDWLGFVAGFGVETTVKAIDPDLWDGIKVTVREIADGEHSATVRQWITDPSTQGSASPGSFYDLNWEGIPVGDLAVEKGSWLAGLIGAPLGFLPILPTLANGGLFPIIEHQGARAYRPARVDIRDAISASWRDQQYSQLDDEDGADQGYTRRRINAIRETMRPLLNEDVVRQLILRGEDPAGNFKEDLYRAGWTNDRIDALEKLYQVIPNVQDLIRMAVREAFSPEIAEQFGQYQDFPGDFAEWAAKQGLSDFWARAYWASHWDLPSPNQAFEMFQRTTFDKTEFSGSSIGTSGGRAYYRVIDRDHLNLLLRALDVMPAWRDKLTRIAFNPYTRVDIRRMYNTGVVDRDEVKRTYIDLGYDDEHAENLTEFTVRDETEKQRSVTESKILKAYRQGDITRNETLELLVEIGYTEDDADFVIATEEDDAVSSKRDLTVSNIKSLYQAGVNDKTETTERLTGLGYSADAIAELYSLWDLETKAAVRALTRSEITHFLSVGIINEDQFKVEMQSIGYPDKYIGYYLQEFAADEVAQAKADEEKARIAQEKVEAAKVKSEYEKSKAKLDVEIAVARTYIAEQNLAKTLTEDADLLAAIKENVAAARLEIADLQEQKARLKLD